MYDDELMTKIYIMLNTGVSIFIKNLLLNIDKINYVVSNLFLIFFCHYVGVCDIPLSYYWLYYVYFFTLSLVFPVIIYTCIWNNPIRFIVNTKFLLIMCVLFFNKTRKMQSINNVQITLHYIVRGCKPIFTWHVEH